jgi:hypothetical protein
MSMYLMFHTVDSAIQLSTSFLCTDPGLFILHFLLHYIAISRPLVQILDPESNLCYGEGGAGTWSDGKVCTDVELF